MTAVPRFTNPIFDRTRGGRRCARIGVFKPLQELLTELIEGGRGFAVQDPTVCLALDEVLRRLVAGRTCQDDLRNG